MTDSPNSVYPADYYETAATPPQEHYIMDSGFASERHEVDATPKAETEVAAVEDYRQKYVGGERLDDYDKEAAAQIEMPGLAGLFSAHAIQMGEIAGVRQEIGEINLRISRLRSKPVEKKYGEYGAIAADANDLLIANELLNQKEDLLESKRANLRVTEQAIRDYRRAKLNEYYILANHYERVRQES